MTRDYGERAKRKATRRETVVRWTGLAIGAAIAVTIVGVSWARLLHHVAAERPYWTVSGPPCPTLASVSAFVSPKPDLAFDYADVVFARAYGHVSCALVPYPWSLGLMTYPVCQFTSPDVLRIGASGKDVYFSTGPGTPATVSVRGGVARCVMASNFR